jgi:hypothetical protein
VTAWRADSAARSRAFSHCRVKSTFTSLKMLSRRSACWYSGPSMGSLSRFGKNDSSVSALLLVVASPKYV